jgi:hypothetical protein
MNSSNPSWSFHFLPGRQCRGMGAVLKAEKERTDYERKP